jgi:hypothetical protein
VLCVWCVRVCVCACFVCGGVGGSRCVEFTNSEVKAYIQFATIDIVHISIIWL